MALEETLSKASLSLSLSLSLSFFLARFTSLDVRQSALTHTAEDKSSQAPLPRKQKQKQNEKREMNERFLLPPLKEAVAFVRSVEAVVMEAVMMM